MFSFGRRSTGKVALVVDVESGSVGAAVAHIPSEGPAEVYRSERAVLPFEERTKEQSATALIGALDELIARVVKAYSESETGKKAGPPFALHAIVGAPWVRSRTAKETERFSGSQTIADPKIKELAKKALQQPSNLDQQSIFETTVTRVQLNGYKTAEPVGKRARDITVTVFQSDINSTIRTGLESVLGKHLPGRSVDIRSETRALSTVAHERIRSEHFTIIVVGSFATNVVAVHKEELMEMGTVEEGSAGIIQRAAGEHGLPEETLSLMRMVAADACSLPACEELKTRMATIEPELVKIFGETFGKLATIRRLPNHCLLSVHADMTPWFEHFLARLDFSPFTITMQPFVVESLTPEHVRDLVSWHPGTREDAGLATAIAFVNSAHHS